MINTKRPNTDDYTQVGFIEAKDGQGDYQNIDHIYDSEGNIVFQQGYLNEYDGADDFSIPAIGKPLIDYTIYGNTFQDGIPTPDNPIMPQGTGERTANLFDISTAALGKWINSAGEEKTSSVQTPQYRLNHTDYISIEPNAEYTFSYDGDFSTSITVAMCWFNSNKEIVAKSDYPTGGQKVYSFSATAPSDARYCIVNFTGYNGVGKSDMMFAVSSSAVLYEPYGYKLDISSGGVNLFDQSDFSLLQVTSTTYRYGTSLGVLSQGTYTFNATKIAGAQSIYLTANLNGVYSQTTISSIPFSFTADGNSEYIIRTAKNTGTTWEAEKYSDMMLNTGPEALPYEPYIEPIETNIYLGEVETTRRIKKLVLTGEETITKAASNPVFTIQLGGSNTPLSENAVTTLSTHYQSQNNVAGTGNVGDMRVCIRRGYGTMHMGDARYDNITDFKSYLAAQYAAGTPVTVWYVLATPTTSIVNEPIMRIGDYADTLSMEQAGVEVPTLKRPNTTEIDIITSLPPSEVYAKYRGSKTQKYDLFLAANGDSFEAKNGQSLYIGDDT